MHDVTRWERQPQARSGSRVLLLPGRAPGAPPRVAARRSFFKGGSLRVSQRPPGAATHVLGCPAINLSRPRARVRLPECCSQAGTGPQARTSRRLPELAGAHFQRTDARFNAAIVRRPPSVFTDQGTRYTANSHPGSAPTVARSAPPSTATEANGCWPDRALPGESGTDRRRDRRDAVSDRRQRGFFFEASPITIALYGRSPRAAGGSPGGSLTTRIASRGGKTRPGTENLGRQSPSLTAFTDWYREELRIRRSAPAGVLIPGSHEPGRLFARWRPASRGR